MLEFRWDLPLSQWSDADIEKWKREYPPRILQGESIIRVRFYEDEEGLINTIELHESVGTHVAAECDQDGDYLDAHGKSKYVIRGEIDQVHIVVTNTELKMFRSFFPKRDPNDGGVYPRV